MATWCGRNQGVVGSSPTRPTKNRSSAMALRLLLPLSRTYNILRKGKPEAFDADGVEGVLVHPTVIKTVE